MNNKRQRNKLFTMLLLVVALLIPQWGWAQEASQPQNGDGTESNPFQIATAEELAWFRDYVNSGNKSACAKLADNIDLSGFCHAADESKNIDELSWEPIGNDTYNYKGTFDGNGKTISNLYIKTDLKEYTGFFGYVTGTIKNVTFDNASIENSEGACIGILAGATFYATLQNIKTLSTCTVKGAERTGGIAGAAGGNINNCENHAIVNGTETVGGLFGRYDGSKDSFIAACANYGNVTSTSAFAGGLVGEFYSGTIKDCANYGDITGSNMVGGIVGYFTGKIQNVFCYGNVSNTEDYCYEGGLTLGYSMQGSIDGIVAYYSGAKLTLNGEVQEAHAFGNVQDDKATGYTQEQIASGEVAWLLNGSTSAPAEGETLTWYQKLGDNADAYPVLTSTGVNTVYHGTDCYMSADVYTNDNSIFGEDGILHQFEIANQPDANGLYGDVCVNCNANNGNVKYIHNFCGVWGNDVKLTVESDGSYTATEPVTINDASTYDSPVDFIAPTLEYTREYLGDNQWQAVYVPFETEVTDWTNNGITVASINNFHEYEKEDGSGYETVLEVKKATSGVFDANTPYVVRSSENGSESKTITINNVKLHKASSNTYYCMSMTRKYDFTGIYTPQNGLGQDDASTVYALNKQGQMAPLRPTTTLGAQRWYLTVSDRNGSSMPQDFIAHSIRIDMVGEGSTTGIEDIQVITNNGTGNTSNSGIYDLQGRKLSKEPTRGIYIKNGKKYVK